MEIIGYVVYGIGVLFAVAWLIGIRTYTNSGQGLTISTVNTTMLFIVSLALVPILQVDPLHLLWMYPLSFVLGMLSLVFPFSLLSIPGHLVGWIACIGLNQAEIAIKQERIHKLQELMITESITAEEAKAQLEENGEW